MAGRSYRPCTAIGHTPREHGRLPGGGLCSETVQIGVVGQAAALQGGDVVAVQRRQVGALARADGGERRDRRAGLAQVVDGAQQRAWQSGCLGNGREVPGPAGAMGDQAGHEALAQQRRQQAQLAGGESAGGEG